MRRLGCRDSEQRDFRRWPDAVGEPPAGKVPGRAAGRQEAGFGPLAGKEPASGRQPTRSCERSGRGAERGGRRPGRAWRRRRRGRRESRTVIRNRRGVWDGNDLHRLKSEDWIEGRLGGRGPERRLETVSRGAFGWPGSASVRVDPSQSDSDMQVCASGVMCVRALVRAFVLAYGSNSGQNRRLREDRTNDSDKRLRQETKTRDSDTRLGQATQTNVDAGQRHGRPPGRRAQREAASGPSTCRPDARRARGTVRVTGPAPSKSPARSLLSHGARVTGLGKSPSHWAEQKSRAGRYPNRPGSGPVRVSTSESARRPRGDDRRSRRFFRSRRLGVTAP